MNESTAESSGRNVTDINNDHENEDTTRAALDELLQTKLKLQKAMEIKYEAKRQWRQREAAVHCSNWKLELELQKLRKISDELDQEISAKARENRKAHEDLELYKSRNKQEATDFWVHFQEETEKYSNLFPNAHIEYSSMCLNQDIKEYRREADIVREKIARIKNEMEAATTRYGLVELGTNEEAKLLADLDAVKKTLSDKKEIIRATETAEEVIDVLKLKVKQKEHDIAYLKNKTDNK